MTKVPDRAGWWWCGGYPVHIVMAERGLFRRDLMIYISPESDWQGPCIRPSVPLPAPKAGGREVTPCLVADLLEHGFDDAAQLVLERDAFGRGKYGQGLMTDDGREKIEDARQEFGDILQYVAGAKMEGKDLSPIRALVPALLHVLGVV